MLTSKPRSRFRGVGIAYLYIAPFFVVFFAFFAYPLGYSFYLSLHRWAGIGPMKPVGWGNYTFALQNPFFWGAVRTTAVTWLLVLPFGTAVSMAVAVAWNRKTFLLRSIAIVLYLLPCVISIVAISVVFRILYDQSVGPIDAVITSIGLPSVAWLGDENSARVGVAIVRIWESVGLGALFYFASLQNISQEIYDAADVDGCSALRKFSNITVPLLMRSTLFVTVINTLAVFSLFAEPEIITNDGGPNNATTTIGLYLYHLVLNLDYGTAAAVSFLATVGMMLVSVMLFLIGRRWMTT